MAIVKEFRCSLCSLCVFFHERIPYPKKIQIQNQTSKSKIKRRFWYFCGCFLVVDLIGIEGIEIGERGHLGISF